MKLQNIELREPISLKNASERFQYLEAGKGSINSGVHVEELELDEALRVIWITARNPQGTARHGIPLEAVRRFLPVAETAQSPAPKPTPKLTVVKPKK